MRKAAVELTLRKVRLVVADGESVVACEEVVPPTLEHIGPAERRRLVALLEPLRDRAHRLGAKRITAIATGDLRRLRGISALQAVLPGRLGFELVLPSAVEERRLVYQGVVGTSTGRMAVIHFAEDWADFVVGDGRSILFEETLPVGLATLERSFDGELSTAGEHAARLAQAITALVAPVAERVRALGPDRIVFAADPASGAAGVVLGVVAHLLASGSPGSGLPYEAGSRLSHRPLAEGLLACQLHVVDAEAGAADGDEEVGVADLAAET